MEKQSSEKADLRSKNKSEHAAIEAPKKKPPREIGGREGPDPTRYGDWEKKGRCIDF